MSDELLLREQILNVITGAVATNMSYPKGLTWDEAVSEILAKVKQHYEQKDWKCQSCHRLINHDPRSTAAICVLCGGTSELQVLEQKDRPDREKIAIEIYESTEPTGYRDWKYLSKERKVFFRGIGDQIIDLLAKDTRIAEMVSPDEAREAIEEAKEQERKDIGLELELALSKVINKPNFNQYRLSEFITIVTHKLYKGQALKERK